MLSQIPKPAAMEISIPQELEHWSEKSLPQPLETPSELLLHQTLDTLSELLIDLEIYLEAPEVRAKH